MHLDMDDMYTVIAQRPHLAHLTVKSSRYGAATMRHAVSAVTCAVRCKAFTCEVALASCDCRLSTTTRFTNPSRCWRAVGTASAALLSPDEYATDSLTCLRRRAHSIAIS